MDEAAMADLADLTDRSFERYRAAGLP